jgi:hypothetical protein
MRPFFPRFIFDALTNVSALKSLLLFWPLFPPINSGSDFYLFVVRLAHPIGWRQSVSVREYHCFGLYCVRVHVHMCVGMFFIFFIQLDVQDIAKLVFMVCVCVACATFCVGVCEECVCTYIHVCVYVYIYIYMYMYVYKKFNRDEVAAFKNICTYFHKHTNACRH